MSRAEWVNCVAKPIVVFAQMVMLSAFVCWAFYWLIRLMFLLQGCP